MGLTNYKLGELLELCQERNSNNAYSLKDVKGISIKKEFIETKADMAGVALTPYILVRPDSFAYVTVTSRNGEKITIAHNTSNNTFIVSSSYVVFRVRRPEIVSSDYLFLFFNRPEFDRYARFNSWGSARETFYWEDFCDTDIILPDIETQRKFVSIYKALNENLLVYQSKAEDLKTVCEGYIDQLKKNSNPDRIGDYIELCDLHNDDNKLGINSLRGISTDKAFIESKADMLDVSLTNYKIVSPNELAYVADTSRRGDKVALAFNDSEESFLISSIYTVFKVKDENTLDPHYLTMFLTRAEFDRYARFNSWGSARETFDWSEMCDVAIPIPNISIQREIVDIHKCYLERQRIADSLKKQINAICPVLIKGSLETTN